jgi:L-fucose isomerase-like protein
MQTNPRLGLVLVRSGEFRCVETASFQEAIRADEQIVLDRLSRVFEVVGVWVVDSPDGVRSCVETLPGADLDLVLLAYQTWAPDGPLSVLLKAFGELPLVLWCYLPSTRLARPASFSELQRTSGLVGTFAALGTLRNQGADFFFTFGAPDDPHLIHDLRVAGRAARLRRELRSARIGILPALSSRMECTFVDEARLADELGPRVEYIPVEVFRQAADEIPEADLNAYLDELRARFTIEAVDDLTLVQAARAALGLARLARERSLHVLAINDDTPTLYQAFGMRPALYPDLTGESQTVFQPEADLGAATANYILHRLTGSPTLFLELYFWDEPKNQLVGGHGGMQNPALADPREVRITPDYDCYLPKTDEQTSLSGAQLQFLASPGRVTLFQLRSTPAGWQAVALSGVCLEGQPWLEGFPHVILRLDTPMEHFLNQAAEVGVTQHWVMVYGSVLNELEAFCQMVRIPLEVLSH